jgi:hypothetical protein
MGKPQVDIQVDDVTGRWSVHALPMILVPQHFFLNNHYAVEAVLGPEKLEEVLRPAGHRSAYWSSRCGIPSPAPIIPRRPSSKSRWVWRPW